MATQEGIGDNVEFNVATASDIEIFFNGGSTGVLTSTSNTTTTKYTNTAQSRKKFCLRADESVEILEFNGVEPTDPYTCVKDGSITEKWDSPLLI